ncbi:MAG: riboflavin synthase [Polyangiaceae bacterium]
MFTGLVEKTGILRAREARGPGYRIAIEVDLGSLALGESIAVSGVCLTVIDVLEPGFAADVSRETVEKTTLGRCTVGSAVNLERALAVGDRLGGHWVSGHVDGIASVKSITNAGEAWVVRVAPPAELMPYLAPKGSVTLDGVSLTINAARESDFDIALIPHTRTVTNFSALRTGSELNLEVDVLARYVVHYLSRVGGAPARDARLADALVRAGLMSPEENG